MRCPNCGAETRQDDEVFCRKCGTKLTPEVKKATIVPKKQCKTCGKFIDSDLTICPSCNANPDVITSSNSSSSNDDSTCYGCCALIIIICIILWLLGLIF